MTVDGRYSDELRQYAEAILERARNDEEFRERLRTETLSSLDEVAQAQQFITVKVPVFGDAAICVDFTCVFTPSWCPETCLPGMTFVMCTFAETAAIEAPP